MSATRSPMVLTTLAIFRGLQERLREILRDLPDHTLAKLRQGLVRAHTKLSDYCTKFDASPYYIWASLLNPRISYEGLKVDYQCYKALLAFLEASKTRFQDHFRTHYMTHTLASSLSSTSSASQSTTASPHAPHLPRKSILCLVMLGKIGWQ
ncbi:hypothetical protein HGRIS_014904 [Hohenbuehelia grisea]|uniref:Uncharacterized protein n=1 Tax=Hohenbuehelia grisea TaxID=104357 RepID=A0ABR3JR67_9AGAR